MEYRLLDGILGVQHVEVFGVVLNVSKELLAVQVLRKSHSYQHWKDRQLVALSESRRR